MTTANEAISKNRNELLSSYNKVRKATEALVAPLTEADLQLQSMPDVSPGKWHLAHTTWFFETFILCPRLNHYRRFNEAFNYLFNSYYNGVGGQYPRSQRGLISRPSLQEVMAFRQHVDQWMSAYLQDDGLDDEICRLIELGLHHEQQHQELMLTDIKHCLFQNPLYPAYQSDFTTPHQMLPPLTWLPLKSGLQTLGYDKAGFSFDNERPAHPVYLGECELASRLVTNGEYQAFIEAGGYQNPHHWLSDGWAWVQQQGQQQPLYWLQQDGKWYEFTLQGLQALDAMLPVSHVNYYEASAYASWRGLRLPTEFEWEAAVKQYQVSPEEHAPRLHPDISLVSEDLQQAFGQVWQWTCSNYGAYPGFKPFAGTAGEYNGKFMSNQYVLRGSSCVTPAGHARQTYRNFFYAPQAWQFMGIRLARTIYEYKMSSTTLVNNVVDQAFLSDVVDGLSRKQKVLPCKYFYDEKGSLLFEAICETSEYYVTRTEMDIYRRYAEQMSAFIGENVLLIEPGAGSIKKVSLILDELKNPAGFIPMDISPEILQASSRILEKRFPELDITPLVVDFLDESALKAIFATMPAAPLVDKRVIFFPGSTIGNFSPVEAKQFLGHFYDNLQAGDGLLIGVDLVKNAQVLEAAYDDQKGVTADFNLNLLHRINNELKGEFKLENFAHKALFNTADSRIEMHIVSTEDQQVAIAEQHFSFAQGETIHTENSYKYTTDDFVALAAEVGFQSEKVWVDDEQLFSVHYFTVPS